MDRIRQALAGIVPAQEITCIHVAGMPPTIRIIKDRNSTLILVVAPIDRTREVLRAFGKGNEAFTYGIIGASADTFGALDLTARFGSTGRHPRGRFARHLAMPPVPGATTMFIVAGRNADVLTPDLATALESECARVAGAADNYRVVGAYNLPTLTAPTRLVVERWISELRLMLIDAGIAVFEKRLDDQPAPVDIVQTLRAGYSLAVPADLADRPGATRWVLRSGEVRARAVCHDSIVMIEPGARGRLKGVPSHQACIARKAKELRERRILVPVPGRRHLVETTRSIRVPSLVNAARLLLGNNDRGQGWRRVA